MRVLLTGGSSFTGVRFARTLVAAGAEVHLTLTGRVTDYDGARRTRIDSLPAQVVVHEGIRHGDGGVAGLLRSVAVDAVGYHAHPMSGFRDADYDHVGAVGELTRHLADELDAVATQGARLVYSGTVYEPTVDRPAVSAYGVSKATVWEHLRFGAAGRGIALTRFVIPNPFGPAEEGRFGNYLAATWGRGETPVVRTPDYIRDNIPVGELAERYLSALCDPAAPAEIRPSGYIESQAAFARRVAQEVGRRLGRTLEVDALTDAPHPEPARVVNDGSHSAGFPEREASYWDEYSDWMADQMGAR